MELNKRYLIERERIHQKGSKIEIVQPEEVIIKEFSPTGVYVKLEFPNYPEGDFRFDWRKVEEIEIVEPLDTEELSY